MNQLSEWKDDNDEHSEVSSQTSYLDSRLDEGDVGDEDSSELDSEETSQPPSKAGSRPCSARSGFKLSLNNQDLKPVSSKLSHRSMISDGEHTQRSAGSSVASTKRGGRYKKQFPQFNARRKLRGKQDALAAQQMLHEFEEELKDLDQRKLMLHRIRKELRDDYKKKYPKRTSLEKRLVEFDAANQKEILKKTRRQSQASLPKPAAGSWGAKNPFERQQKKEKEREARWYRDFEKHKDQRFALPVQAPLPLTSFGNNRPKTSQGFMDSKSQKNSSQTQSKDGVGEKWVSHVSGIERFPVFYPMQLVTVNGIRLHAARFKNLKLVPDHTRQGIPPRPHTSLGIVAPTAPDSGGVGRSAPPGFGSGITFRSGPSSRSVLPMTPGGSIGPDSWTQGSWSNIRGSSGTVPTLV
eukprot:Rmarinus@m.13989